MEISEPAHSKEDHASPMPSKQRSCRRTHTAYVPTSWPRAEAWSGCILRYPASKERIVHPAMHDMLPDDPAGQTVVEDGMAARMTCRCTAREFQVWSRGVGRLRDWTPVRLNPSRQRGMQAHVHRADFAQCVHGCNGHTSWRLKNHNADTTYLSRILETWRLEEVMLFVG